MAISYVKVIGAREWYAFPVSLFRFVAQEQKYVVLSQVNMRSAKLSCSPCR